MATNAPFPADVASAASLSPDALSRSAVIALVGNPNTGKTSLFNALTGFSRHVANYPGVTVEVARGPVRGAGRPLEILDLPGTYSLFACAPDEALVCDALRGSATTGPPPAAILVIADGSNLRRNLYLVSQVLELGRPVVVALNMMDVARARGISVNVGLLAQRLGVPVVPVVATRTKTVEPLLGVLVRALDRPPPTPDIAGLPVAPGERAMQITPEEVRARYAWINRVLDGVVDRNLPHGDTWSDRIDHVLVHRVAGAAVLAAVLYGMFWCIYRGAAPLMDVIDAVRIWCAARVAAWLPPGMVQSLIVDGLIAGVGSVLAFLPQIMILFLFIAVLEDCGYLARAAFMVDRVMRLVGLSGRAFIPLLSGFACAVPAIMGTRVIADRRERLITILITPFMSCSARLPIYVLLISALVPPRTYLGGWVRLDALTMLAMYLVGAACAVPIAWLLKKTVLAGPPTGFLLELPSYKLPRLRTVWQRMYLAGRRFVVRAGSIILLVNLIVWALGYFPRSAATRAAVERQRVTAGWDDAAFHAQLDGAYLRDSFLGRLGRGIEPAIRPMGWDWHVGIAVLSSFPAREVVIATLGTVFNLEDSDKQGTKALRDSIRAMKWEGTNRPVFTLPVALSVMVFFALCAQCAATLAVIGRETRSWVWPTLSFVGMTTIAYLAAWGVSVGARLIGL